MNTRTLIKTSTFPASADEVFQKMLNLRTLQKVAYPFASFTPVDETQSGTWQAGKSYSFRFKLFCVLPMGVHTIQVMELDTESWNIYTHEYNPHVPVWNHRIYLKPTGSESTSYTDEVEIFAGWKTPFIYLWSKWFYSHRQKRWIRFLAEGILSD